MTEPAAASQIPPGAMCAVHPTMRALLTCTRCGSFACAGCRSAPGSSLCKACAQKGGAAIDPETADRIRKLMRKYNLVSFAIALPGLLLSGFGQMMTANPDPKTAEAGTAISSLGSLLFVVGLGFYARMKGRSGLNALWGLLSCIGLLVLAFLNKHCHNCKHSSSFRTKQCPQCGAPM